AGVVPGGPGQSGGCRADGHVPVAPAPATGYGAETCAGRGGVAAADAECRGWTFFGHLAALAASAFRPQSLRRQASRPQPAALTSAPPAVTPIPGRSPRKTRDDSRTRPSSRAFIAASVETRLQAAPVTLTPPAACCLLPARRKSTADRTGTTTR